MSREIGQIAIGIGVVVLILAAVVIGGVRPTTVETGPGPDLRGSATPSAGVGPDGARVRGGGQSSGVSVLGLFSFGGSTTLKIEFPVTGECFESVAIGDVWPAPIPACESPVPAVGEVIQLPDNTGRGQLVVVEMSVSSECFVVAVGGSAWPTGRDECSSEEGR